MTEQQLQDLLRKYREGLCTPEEKTAIESWYKDKIDQTNWDFAPGTEQQIGARMHQQLKTRLGLKKPAKPVAMTLRRIAAAAAILVFLATGSYFLFFREKDSTGIVQKNEKPTDIAAPTANRAMISLANGQTVYLDSAENGSLANQGAVNIVKLADGQIAYTGSSSETLYNTLSNPRGSKAITITLSDGTKVWLNSESSLRYPVSFVGDERRVEITGEAYFEVAHNVASPFTVSRGDLQVQVLGTHFNVNAYEDENDIKVTLLEGSVNVANGESQLKLKPGQQAKANREGTLALSKSVNPEQVMAWKNELFLFKETDIKTVMRQIARWYNVDIEYKGEVTEKFIVDINRNTNVSNVFKILEATGGVRFNIEGRKITVLP